MVRVLLLALEKCPVVVGIPLPLVCRLVKEPSVDRRLALRSADDGLLATAVGVLQRDALGAIAELLVLLRAVLLDDARAVLLEALVESDVRCGERRVALLQDVVRL